MKSNESGYKDQKRQNSVVVSIKADKEEDARSCQSLVTSKAANYDHSMNGEEPSEHNNDSKKTSQIENEKLSEIMIGALTINQRFLRV